MRTLGRKPFRTCLLLALTSLIAACGGGGGGDGSNASLSVGSSPPPLPAPSPPPSQPDPESGIITATLSGSVGDGPVVDAALSFYDRDGADIASFSSGSSADYRLSLRVRPEQFPLTIEAIGGTDLVSGTTPDFPLLTVVPEPAKQLTANLNPFSTLIVHSARLMRGGPTLNNLASARISVLSHFGFGLDRRLVPDPMQTAITNDNVAVMVKASEAAAETVRRVRDELIGVGVQSAEQVIEALAADLIDGVIDGRGAAGADPRVDAVATAVTAKVMVESLTNELKVLGVPASAAMDNAIGTIRPGVAPEARTSSVANTRQALVQTALSLSAAATIAPDAALDAAVEAVNRLAEDTLPDAARGRFPPGLTVALDRAIERSVYASEPELERLNARTRAGWDEQPGDPAVLATYRLSAESIEAREGDAIKFKIRRDVDAGEEYIVWRTRDVTATGYDDYEYGHSQTVHFGPGEMVKNVILQTIDDGVAEDNETFEVLLVEALDGGDLGDPALIRITLLDTGGQKPPEEPPPPPAPAMVAPSLDSATVADGYFQLAWSHPRDGLDGGFDVIVDGVGTGRDYRTDGLSARVGPLDDSVGHCFQIEARYVRANRFPRSNTVCVDPPAPPETGGGEFVAPVLDSVTADGDRYSLAWRHPRNDVNGGFDVIIDGSSTKTTYRTMELAATVGPLDPGVRHCFAIEARYVRAQKFLKSNTVCVDGQEQANRTPTIGGQPGGVAAVGQVWRFKPEATDPDGDQLTFSIANQPSWAQFDPSTGRLRGTPGADDAGTHAGIVITVSDGKSSASLGAFSIEVRPAADGTGSITLSWDPPNRRTDGTALEGLSGYRIYTGPSRDKLTLAVTIDNPGLATYVLDDLAAGSWTFAITAIDGLGQESRFSNLVSTVVD